MSKSTLASCSRARTLSGARELRPGRPIGLLPRCLSRNRGKAIPENAAERISYLVWESLWYGQVAPFDVGQSLGCQPKRLSEVSLAYTCGPPSFHDV